MSMWEQSLQTCRFCKESDYAGTDTMVKYGVRHYAHFACYLDAGKKLEDLHAWQVGLFPYRLLKERRLDDVAANIVGAMRHHGRQP
jgi:hypothetical protein